MNLQTFLVSVGAMALVLSIFLAGEHERMEKLQTEVRPVRATLLSTVVKEWIPGRENWNAFGTFAIAADDFHGEAEGSLQPAGFLRGKGRRYKVSRAEAEGFLPGWVVGQTYDAFQYPDHRSSVFFQKPDAETLARQVLWMRIAGVLLVVGGLALGYRRHRLGVQQTGAGR